MLEDLKNKAGIFLYSMCKKAANAMEEDKNTANMQPKFTPEAIGSSTLSDQLGDTTLLSFNRKSKDGVTDTFEAGTARFNNPLEQLTALSGQVTQGTGAGDFVSQQKFIQKDQEDTLQEVLERAKELAKTTDPGDNISRGQVFDSSGEIRQDKIAASLNNDESYKDLTTFKRNTSYNPLNNYTPNNRERIVSDYVDSGAAKRLPDTKLKDEHMRKLLDPASYNAYKNFSSGARNYLKYRTINNLGGEGRAVSAINRLKDPYEAISSDVPEGAAIGQVTPEDTETEQNQ